MKISPKRIHWVDMVGWWLLRFRPGEPAARVYQVNEAWTFGPGVGWYAGEVVTLDDLRMQRCENMHKMFIDIVFTLKEAEKTDF